MGQIHGSGNSNFSNTVMVDDSVNTTLNQGRLLVNTYASNGVPGVYTSSTQSSKQFNILKGNLNKLRLRPQIQNEYCESSHEAIGNVGSNTGSMTAVGQIFKSSQDNINGISLTLQSADTFASFDAIASGASPTEKKLGTQEYSSTGSLRAEWIANNTLASRAAYTDKVGTTQDGNWALQIPMDTKTDTWTGSIVSTDFTGYTFKLKYANTENFNKAKLYFFIGDGTNSKSVPLTINNKEIWQSINIPETAMDVTDNDLTATTPDITAITRIGFRNDLKEANEFGYVDSITYQTTPGNVDIKLWDLGSTLPSGDGSYNYKSGTQYVQIGDRGIDNIITSGIRLEMDGGKRKYFIDNFIAGVALEISGNTTLTSGNYYSLVLNYVDTPVTVYGPDTNQKTNYYTNGFAWDASTSNNRIYKISGATGVGSYSDLMFQIFSTQSAYITNNQLLMNNPPSGNTSVQIFAEDENMGITDIVTPNEQGGMGRTKLDFDLSNRPVLLNKGGKFEAYYNDDPRDSVDKILFSIGYQYEPPTING